MTVEIKVIPMGVSGIKKKKSTKKRTPRPRRPEPGERSPSCYYEQRVKQTAMRMEAENKRENLRVTPKGLRKIIRNTIKAGNPNISSHELEDLVNQVWPTAVANYRGAGKLIHEPSDLE